MLHLARTAFYLVSLIGCHVHLSCEDDADAIPARNMTQSENDQRQNVSSLPPQLLTTPSSPQELPSGPTPENSTASEAFGQQGGEFDSPHTICQDQGNDTVSTPSSEQDCDHQESTTASPSEEGNGRRSSSLIDQGSVSRDTYLSIFKVSQILVMVFGVVGVVENAVNVVVLSRPGMRSPSSVILFYLAVAELLYCLVSVGWQSLTYYYGSDAVQKYHYLMAAIYAYNYFCVGIRRWGYCLNLLVSCERFVAVAFPLRRKSLRPTQHPTALCLSMAVLMLAAHVYNIFKNEVVEQYPGVYRLAKSVLARKHGQLFETVSTVSKVLFAIIPLLASLLFNVLTILALHRHVRRRRRHLHQAKDDSQTVQHERQTTIVVLVSSMLFVLLSMPVILVSLLQNFHPSFGSYRLEHFLYLSVLKVGSLCEVASNVTSFLVYLALSSRYRQELLAMLPRAGTARWSKSAKASLDNPVCALRGDLTSTSICAETSVAGAESSGN